MSAPTFTILLPVHRPPDLLPFAVQTVLDQSRPDFELFIICDGAPPETAATAKAFESSDRRVRAFVQLKGERHGEIWRHLALQEARGRIICQIGDDDLWFPDHLTEVEALMAEADFGNTVALFLEPDGAPQLYFGDLADPEARRRMEAGASNLFGPTAAAYRLDAYRALPIGWSPAPEGHWSDLWMWRKFLAQPNLVCATRFKATALGLPAAMRRDWDLDRRRAEIAGWAARIRDASVRDQLWRLGLANAARKQRALLSENDLLRRLGRRVVESLDAAEDSLVRIAAAAQDDNVKGLAHAALERLPDREWRRGLRRGPGE